MSDEDIEWHESDEKYTSLESEEIPLSTALYDASCGECGGELDALTMSADPDHPVFSGECYECGAPHTFTVTKVVGTTSDPGL